MSTVAERKAGLRRELRNKLAALTPAERAAAADRVVTTIRRHEVWRQARTVMLFIPLPDEVNILPLVNDALDQGRTVLLPRFDPATNRYHAARIRQLPNDLVPGRFDTLEPSAACPAHPLKPLDVTLVPGLGFDRVGRRLGRGKGYYDRLLADASGRFWGVGFDCQLTGSLPEEPHDVVLNCIVTPAQWIEVGSGRR